MQPKSYIETTDRRDLAANRQIGGEDRCYREKKIRNFVVWAEPDQKTAFSPFVYHVHSLQKQFYPMESRDSEGVSFASVESL